MLNLNQKTIKRKVKFVGVGLHTGKKVNLVLVPASPNHGIVFKRTDLKMNNQIDANFENVKEATPLCTTIQMNLVLASQLLNICWVLFVERKLIIY